MADQISQSFDKVLTQPNEILIMGNSRTYRGLNPEFISPRCYNFSFDNETFFEQYYKLKYLEQQSITPELLILGVDYFEFSFLSLAMRNSYMPYFDTRYSIELDSLSQSGNQFEFGESENVDDFVNKKMSAVFGRGASQYLSYVYRQLKEDTLMYPYLKDNGQYIINPVPKAQDGEFLTRSSAVNDYQKDKFEQIVTYCKENKIKLLLLMPPCRDIELQCYTETFKDSLNNYFHSFEDKDNIWYLNLSEQHPYTTADFMDDTHLTPLAADRFSYEIQQYINNEIYGFE